MVVGLHLVGVGDHWRGVVRIRSLDPTSEIYFTRGVESGSTSLLSFFQFIFHPRTSLCHFLHSLSTSVSSFDPEVEFVSVKKTLWRRVVYEELGLIRQWSRRGWVTVGSSRGPSLPWTLPRPSTTLRDCERSRSQDKCFWYTCQQNRSPLRTSPPSPMCVSSLPSVGKPGTDKEKQPYDHDSSDLRTETPTGPRPRSVCRTSLLKVSFGVVRVLGLSLEICSQGPVDLS